MPPLPARALAAEAARLATALADLLEGLVDAGDAALASSCAFLRHMAEEARPGPAPDEGGPLSRLATALALSPLESDLVVLAGLPEEHAGYAGVLRGLHPLGLPRPTVGLAAQLLCPSQAAQHELRTLLATGPAVHHGLLRVGADGPLPDRTLELPGDLWTELAGVPVPALHPPPDAPGLADWLASPAATRAAQALAEDERCTILVTADDVDAARERAVALVAAAGREALAVRPADDPATLALHALARGAVAVVQLAAAEPGGPPAAAPLAHHPRTIVLCARPGTAIGHDERPLLPVPAEPLAVAGRRTMWADLLPELTGAAGELAARHLVEPAIAARVAADVRARAALDDRPPAPRDVADGIRARASGRLPAGIVLRPPVAGWDRLVLPPDRLALLHAAAARLRHQWLVLDDWGFLRDRPGARGVRMLFAGPPGTGKTLAAEVLARALEADLMVVDISRVLSKWIGETEQRLAEVFDAAERSQAVLLFDEADALFGRRTEVSDAHDRYANLETAYLLQRLERFEGLAVLATNLRHNIDAAFTRRLEFVVEFDEPGPQEREALWLAHVPGHAPVSADVDFTELAGRYPVVGGVITRDHALRALEREYDKHGRAFPGRPPATAAITTEQELHR